MQHFQHNSPLPPPPPLLTILNSHCGLVTLKYCIFGATNDLNPSLNENKSNYTRCSTARSDKSNWKQPIWWNPMDFYIRYSDIYDMVDLEFGPFNRATKVHPGHGYVKIFAQLTWVKSLPGNCLLCRATRGTCRSKMTNSCKISTTPGKEGPRDN